MIEKLCFGKQKNCVLSVLSRLVWARALRQWSLLSCPIWWFPVIIQSIYYPRLLSFEFPSMDFHTHGMPGCQAPPSAPRQFHQKRGRATLGRLTALANNGAISASRNPAIPQPMRVTRKRVSGCSLAYWRNSST